MSALLQVENLSVSFRQEGRLTPAVRNISFSLNRGETVALVGESGSGKSVSALSTVSLLGDSAVVSGSVKYAGQQMIGADEGQLRQVRGNDISFIFQEPMTSLNPLHTIERQLSESLTLHQGLVGAKARALILELLTKVGHIFLTIGIGTTFKCFKCGGVISKILNLENVEIIGADIHRQILTPVIGPTLIGNAATGIDR